MKEQLDYCEEWITKEIIKDHIENKDGYITIKKSDLLRMFIKFSKLIDR